jgi:hypothetical protein
MAINNQLVLTALKRDLYERQLKAHKVLNELKQRKITVN